MRIALIHALRHSPPPIEAAFARLWPEATLMNLLDDSLSADLARDGRITEAMTGRFLSLAGYARATGADGILFTCSAFGPCIEAVQRALSPLPVLKPNEAMIEEAQAIGGRIGLLASFAPTLQSMPPEFPGIADGQAEAGGRRARRPRPRRRGRARPAGSVGGRDSDRLRRDRAGAVQPGTGSASGCGRDGQAGADDTGQRRQEAQAAARPIGPA